jgi:predicted CDP-diglyceride synthetase/phosphatidate cytidylyltransferase
MRVAEPVEGVGGFVGVAETAAQGESLVVIVQSLVVITAAVGDVAQAVQGGCLTINVVVVSVQSKSGLAKLAGGVIVAQTGGMPTDAVERVGLPDWQAKVAEKVQGTAGLLQGPAVVPLPR